MLDFYIKVFDNCPDRIQGATFVKNLTHWVLSNNLKVTCTLNIHILSDFFVRFQKSVQLSEKSI